MFVCLDTLIWIELGRIELNWIELGRFGFYGSYRVGRLVRRYLGRVGLVDELIGWICFLFVLSWVGSIEFYIKKNVSAICLR